MPVEFQGNHKTVTKIKVNLIILSLGDITGFETVVSIIYDNDITMINIISFRYAVRCVALNNLPWLQVRNSKVE